MIHKGPDVMLSAGSCLHLAKTPQDGPDVLMGPNEIDLSTIMYPSVNSFIQMYETMDGQPQNNTDFSQPLYSAGIFVEPSPVTFPYYQDVQTGYFYPVMENSPACIYYPVMEQLEPTYGQLEHVSTHLEPIQSVQFQMPQLESVLCKVEYGQLDFSSQFQGQCYMEPIQSQVELPVLIEQQEYGFENPEELYYGSISQYEDQQGTQEQQLPVENKDFSKPPPQTSTVLDSKDGVAEQQSPIRKTRRQQDSRHASGRKCPKGPNCHFAHGPKELRRAPSPAQRPPKDPRRKTMICRNLETCTLGRRCRFLHPEVGAAYLKVVDFEEKKEAHSKKVQALHTIKKLHPEGSQEAMDIEDEINKAVREYNGTKPRGEHYYDLHGMTTNGAEQYVEEIVVEMKKSQVERAWFETGRGNHSKWNFPAIKRLLIDKYSGSNDFTISCDQLNPGILVLTIL
ncbi:unnamed protein product [Caenorhabditis nigoni]